MNAETQRRGGKFAEGKCTPDEEATIERLLTTDPALQAELEVVLEIQSALVGLEPDAPSMRFTQNVMEGLPANLYPPLAEQEPLVRPVWKKIFWLALTAVGAGVFFLPRGQMSPNDPVLPYADKVLDGIGSTVGALPTVTVQYFVMVLLALLTLGVVDRVLAARKTV